MSDTTPATEVFDWRSDYTYGLGIGAFVYGFPYVHNTKVRHDWVTQPQDPEHVPYAPVGQFWHARGLLDASFQGGGSPNNDTMYSNRVGRSERRARDSLAS